MSSIDFGSAFYTTVLLLMIAAVASFIALRLLPPGKVSWVVEENGRPHPRIVSALIVFIVACITALFAASMLDRSLP